ncbi:MAG: hypothetical protein IJ375_02925 [Oscillospiraceae bacterium]|nr:hypothetical protein [Oscillospiraceae bacterium]
MIHIFNREELIITQKMEEMARVREILEANHIEYKLRTENAMGSGPMPGGRARTIPIGNNNSMILYTIYVKDDDLEYATYLIKKR